MARTAKRKIQILDEGVVVTEDAESIDMTGLGVDVTASNNNATVSVPLKGTGVTTITVAAVAPSNPQVGDLWIDIS
jgi:hypothetical protein